MSTIPVRMLNEVSYCERLYHLMHVQGLFEKSADTVEGTMQHERAERHRRPSDVGDVQTWGKAPRTLTLGDASLSIVGKLDAIRVEENGFWEPVESKHSSAPSGNSMFQIGTWQLAGNAWPNDQIQLCAQGLLLRANGFPCERGRLYYRGNKRTVIVPLTDDLVAATFATIRRAQELESASMPSPLVNSDKCFRCSLNNICLPHETLQFRGDEDASSKTRDIVPSRDDLGTVYVTEPGSRVSKRGYELVVYLPTNEQIAIPLKDIRHISLFGNVQATTQLIHECMIQGISISYLTGGGRMVGMAHNLVTKNIHVREAQFRRLRDEEFRTHLARAVVRAKILNQRTLLRRNAQGLDKSILKEMSDLVKRVDQVGTVNSLLGVEGLAAKAYMTAFPRMLRVQDIPAGETLMNGRNRRPPKDPVNALLSLAYALLERDMYVALAAVGLDPLFGFYHTIAPGRPALVLDMMEPFRAIVADSVVIRCLNTREVHWDDFYKGPEACALKPNARKRFFQAYERRMHETVTHPVFQYKLSYRRMLELEARFLSRYLMGDIPDYRPIVTR
ncbi:MAG: CRISPR-associated endonuclease Cas1 [Firmicutes bacterium]|nr:CRISPR-associated endonuclease Cas1 [Bacillota bacterium]